MPSDDPPPEYDGPGNAADSESAKVSQTPGLSAAGRASLYKPMQMWSRSYDWEKEKSSELDDGPDDTTLTEEFTLASDAHRKANKKLREACETAYSQCNVTKEGWVGLRNEIFTAASANPATLEGKNRAMTSMWAGVERRKGSAEGSSRT